MVGAERRGGGARYRLSVSAADKRRNEAEPRPDTAAYRRRSRNGPSRNRPSFQPRSNHSVSPSRPFAPPFPPFSPAPLRERSRGSDVLSPSPLSLSLHVDFLGATSPCDRAGVNPCVCVCHRACDSVRDRRIENSYARRDSDLASGFRFPQKDEKRTKGASSVYRSIHRTLREYRVRQCTKRVYYRVPRVCSVVGEC